MMLYICIKFFENISKGFKFIKRIHKKIKEGKNLVKNVGRVTVLCTMYGSTKYICIKFYKIPIVVSKI